MTLFWNNLHQVRAEPKDWKAVKFWTYSDSVVFSPLCWLDQIRIFNICVFTFWVLSCDVRYDFRKQMMFGSSLPPVVYRRLMSYLRYLCLFAYSGDQDILCCVFVLFFFVLCTLCCHFLWIVNVFAVPSVFSNVYLSTKYYHFIITDARTYYLSVKDWTNANYDGVFIF